MNIGIDIDDTISETFETLLPFAQKYTIEDLKRKSEVQIDSNCSNHFYIVYMNGWNEEEATKFWEKYYAEILKRVNIKTFAAEVIKKLKQKGHNIYLITARWDMRADNVKDITKQWLVDNDVEYDELIINAEDKLKIALEKKIDIFIDDSFKNCKTIADNTEAKVYLMNSRVNGSFNDEKIRRVFSWVEINDLICKEEM